MVKATPINHPLTLTKMKNTKGHFVRITHKAHELLHHLKADENKEHPTKPVSQGAIVEQLARDEFKRRGLDPKKLEA